MKWAVVFCAIGLGGAAWLARPISRPAIARVLPATMPPSRTTVDVAQTAVAVAPVVAQPVRAPTHLEGEALRHRLDDQIPTRLYAAAADCYHGGLPADQHLDLDYHLRVAGGMVGVTTARVESSTLGDRVLERCIVDRVLSASFRDDELPDWEGDDELFVRIGGFKPYLAHVAANGDDPPR